MSAPFTILWTASLPSNVVYGVLFETVQEVDSEKLQASTRMWIRWRIHFFFRMVNQVGRLIFRELVVVEGLAFVRSTAFYCTSEPAGSTRNTGPGNLVSTI